MNGSINHIFRVVWNVSLAVWQVASEHTRGKGKTHSSRSGGTGFSRLAAGGILVLCHAGAMADLPSGGQITAGSGQIGAPSNGHLVIQQDSGKMVVDWNSFSVGQGNSVQFIQPSAEAIALNRVLGGDPSIIRGTIHANGRVVLLNPNGILFGPTSKVEVSSLLASTLNMSNEDFMAGRFRLEGQSSQSVVHQGSIKAADGGFVALVAAKIENVGDIRVRGGEVLMGAGRKVRLDLGGPAKIEVDEAVVNGYIRNGGLIQAEGGSVVMTVKTASELATLAINNEGIIEATSLARGDGGTIRLQAHAGAVVNSGTLNVRSTEGKGGHIEVTGARVGVLNGGVVDASGATGGGTVLLGGDYQGRNAEVANARTTSIAQQAVIRANALKTGNGGKVVAWADENTLYLGQIEARGGADSGNGGFVEVSGKKYLDFQGTVDTSAANGRHGTLLLDPTNLTIGEVATSGWISNQNNSFGDFTTNTDPDPAHDFSFLRVDVLLAALANNDITVLSACDAAACEGTITVKDAITWSSGKALTLDATGSIFINGAITSTGAAGVQGGAFHALAASGHIEVNANITTTGGTATAGAGLSGGNVNLTAATGSVILANHAVIDTSGSAAAAGSAAVGGSAGAIALQSTSGVALNNGDLLAAGGAGDGSAAAGVGGTISLTSAAGDISQGGGSRVAGGNLILKSTSGHINLITGSNAVESFAAESDTGHITYHNLSTAGLRVANIGGVNGVSTGGSGNIELYARNLQIDAHVTSAAGAITLSGNGSALGDHSGIVLNGANVTSESGGIHLTGAGGSGAGGGNHGVVIDGGSVGSDSGPITVTAVGGSAGDQNDAVVFRNNGQIGTTTGNSAVTLQTTVGAGDASVAYRSDANGGRIFTGAGDLTLSGNVLSAAGGTPGVNAPMAVTSTGNLTLRPLNASFANTFSQAAFAADFSFNAAAGGLGDVASLTIGQSGNTANIAIDDALSLAGKTVTLIGGAIDLDKGIVADTLNATASGHINQSEAEGSFTLGTAHISSGDSITLNGVTNSAGALTATATQAITFDNGDNALNLSGSLQAASVHLDAGSVTQTGGTITAGALEVNTSLGGVTLGQNNNVGTLAVDAHGALTFNNGGSSGVLTIGNVGDTTGVTSTGAVTLTGASDLHIGESFSAGTSVTINAGSRHIDLGTETSGKLSLTDAEIDRITATSLTLTTTGNVTNSADVRAGSISAMTISTGQGITNSGDGVLGFSHIDTGALTLSSTGTADGTGVGTPIDYLVTAGASELVLSSARDIYVDAGNSGNTAAMNLDKLHITSTSGAASNNTYSVLSSGAWLTLGRTTAPTWYRAAEQGVLGTYVVGLSNTDALDFKFVGNAPIQVNTSNIGAADFALQTTYGIHLDGNLSGSTGDISLKAGGSNGNFKGITLNGRSVTTQDGSITLEGRGGTGQNTDQYRNQSDQFGVWIDGAGAVRATGTGTISITGQGGSTSSNASNEHGNNSDGVVIAGTGRVESGSGAMAISGTGGSNSWQASRTSDGIVMEASGFITSSSGSVKLTGAGGSGISGTPSRAIAQDGSGVITATGLEIVSTSNGWVNLTNNNNIGTLAGDVRTGMALDNGGNNLTIGTVNDRVGFSDTSSAEIGLVDINALTVEESIEMSSGTLKIAADTIDIANGKRIGDRVSNVARNVNVWLTGRANNGVTAARNIDIGTASLGTLAFTAALLDNIHARNLTLATTGTTAVTAHTDFKHIDQLTLTSTGAISNGGANHLLLSGAGNQGTLELNGSTMGSSGNAVLVRGANRLNVNASGEFNVEAYTDDTASTDLINLRSVNINSSAGGASQTYRILGGGFNVSTTGNGSSYTVHANATGDDAVNFSFQGNAAITVDTSSNLNGGAFGLYATSGNVTIDNAVAISGGNANLRAAGSVVFQGDASLYTGGSVAIRADGDGGALTLDSGTIASATSIGISADNVALGAGSTVVANEGLGTVSIDTRAEVSSGRAIQIGGGDAAGSLSISATELGQIDAARLVVGRTHQSYQTSGAITLGTADLTSSNMAQVDLRSWSGPVVQTGAFSVNALDVSLNSGHITLNQASNEIAGFTANTTGNVVLNNTGYLDIKGIRSNGGAISVTSTGNMENSGAINATASGSGVNQNGAAVSLTSSGATLRVRGDITSNGYSSSNNAHQGGAITLSGQIVELGAVNINSTGTYNAATNGTGGNAGSLVVDATGVGSSILLDGTTINLTGGYGQSANGAGAHLTFNDAVVLASLAGGAPKTVTINAGGGNVAFNGTVDGRDGIGHHLTIGSVRNGTTPSYGSVGFGAAVGTTETIGNLTLNNVQNVSLGSMEAAGIAINNTTGTTTLNGNLTTNGANGIHINSNAISAAGGVGYTTTNGGNVRLATNGSLSLADTSAFNSSGNIDLTAVGGITLSGAQMQTTGAGIIFRSNTALASDLAIDTTGGGTAAAGGNVEFHGTLNSSGGARDLTITSGTAGNVAFNGQVGQTSQLDAVTIQSANNVSISSSFRAESVAVNQSGLLSTGSGGGITAASGFAQTGAGAVQLGANITTTGTDITFASPVTVAGNVTLSTGAASDGDIRFAGAIDSASSAYAGNLTLTAGNGEIAFGGHIGATTALGGLTVNSSQDVVLPVSVTAAALTTNAGGATRLQDGAAITTLSSQNYNDAVVLDGDAVLASTGSGAITFAQSVNGAHDLAVNTGGTTTFGGAVGADVALSSLSTDAGGVTVINGGSVHTTDAQSFGDNAQLGADTSFTSTGGHAITFAGTVDSAGTNRALQVNTAGTTTFAGAVGNTWALSSIDVTHPAGTLLLNGGSFRTTGAQNYSSSHIVLGGDTTLQSTGAGAITLGGNIDAAICTVASLNVLTQGATNFGGAVGTYRPLWSVYTDGAASTPGNTVAFNQGTVVTLGDQTYGELAVLGTHTTLRSLGQGRITFEGPVRAAIDGQQSLTVDTSGDIVFNGAVGDNDQRLASFDAGQSTDGTVHINGGGITTAGTQVYRQQVELGNHAILTGTTGTFNTGVDGNGHDLTLRFSGPTDLEGAKFTGVRHLASDGTGVTHVTGTVATSGTQTYDSDVVLGSDVVLQSTGTGADGHITLAGSVDGAHQLHIDTAGTTRLAGTIGGTTALTSLSTDGPGLTTIGGGGVRTTGSQTYSDAVQVMADAVLTSTQGGDVSFGETVDGPGALQVNTAGVTSFEGGVGSSTALASLTTDAGGRVEINGGSVQTVGEQSYGDDVVLGADTSLSSTSGGTIGFGGTLDGAHHLAIDTSGVTRFDGAVGETTALASLTTDAGGSVVMHGGGIRTTGDQSYGDAVEVTTNTVLVSTGGGDIVFQQTVDGPAALAVNTAGVTRFDQQVGGTTALTSLATDAGGEVVVNGAGVRTTGAQRYGDALTLGSDAELASTNNGDIEFAGTVDGAHALRVTTGGTTRFEDAVGGGVALTALVTGGAGSVNMGGGSIQTTGQQIYHNAVVLAADTVLTSSQSGDIAFHGTLDGQRALSIETGGSTAFNGAVGGQTALASLTTDAGGEVDIGGGSVRTVGAQTFNDGVTVAANTVFSSSGPIGFAGTLDGPWNVTVRTPGVTTFGGAIGSIAPLANLYGGTGEGTIEFFGPSIALTGSLVFEEAVHVRGATTVNAGGEALFYGDAKTGKSLLDVTAGGRIQFGRPIDNMKNYLPTLFSVGSEQAGTDASREDDRESTAACVKSGLPGAASGANCFQMVDLTSTGSAGKPGTQNVTERAVNNTVDQIASNEESRSTTVVVTVNGGVREAGERMVLPK